MAIVTHNTSKNARYSDVLEYYTYKHTEDQETGHYEPVLDEYGFLQEREDYSVVYITAQGEEEPPELWQSACERTNIFYEKNQELQDRKSHEYIISHPEEDREKMSMEDLIQEGKTFIEAYLKGYDCLMAVHRDTDNDHIHISINSVRAEQREEQGWMMKKKGKVLPCEMVAGGKHQDSAQLRRHMNQWLLEYTKDHGYVAKDNNAIADLHRAERHGSKNAQMKAALLEAAGRSKNMKELQRIMREDFNMELKIRGNTFSVQHPDSKKAVRLRTLGLVPADLTRRMASEIFDYTKEIKKTREIKETAARNEVALENERTRKKIQDQMWEIQLEEELYRIREEVEKEKKKKLKEYWDSIAEKKREEEEHKKKEDEKSKKRAQQRREYYISEYKNTQTGEAYKTYLYDRNGRKRTSIDLMFMLAITIITGEAGLWDDPDTPPKKIEVPVLGSCDWRIQNMLDAYYLSQKEGLYYLEDVAGRLQSLDDYELTTKEALKTVSRQLKNMEKVEKALDFYNKANALAVRIEALPECEEKERLMKKYPQLISENNKAKKRLYACNILKGNGLNMEAVQDFQQQREEMEENVANMREFLKHNREEARRIRKLWNKMIKTTDPLFLYGPKYSPERAEQMIQEAQEKNERNQIEQQKREKATDTEISR